MVKVTKGTFLGVEAYEITNDKVKITVATGIGPRIIHFGFCNKDNILRVAKSDFLNKSAGYKFYGGHRLWHSPEDEVRTYQPDNGNVEVEVLELGIKASFIETENMIKKTMQIEMKENGRVRIIHTLENVGDKDFELAVWGITQLKPGGIGVMQQDDRKTGLLPSRSIALWDYTDLSDKRLTFTKNHIIVKQDPNNEKALKIGTYCRQGQLAYFIDGDMFVKDFDVMEGEFTDYGSNAEIYTNDQILELETLSPIYDMSKGQMAEHTEVWELIENVPCPYVDKVMQAEIKETVHA